MTNPTPPAASQPQTTAAVSGRHGAERAGWTILVTGLLASLGFSLYLWWSQGKNSWAPAIPFATSAAITLTGLLLLQLIGLGTGGFLRAVIGEDNRYSTSRVQAGVWTIIALFALAYLFARAFVEPDLTVTTLVPTDRFNTLLILLGGPFAAGVIAKASTSFKISNGTLQKTSSAETAWQQVFKNDEKQTDLVDSQYLLFNFLAMIYFVAWLALHKEMPPLPGPLASVTSAAAAFYAFNKTALTNPPRLTSIRPGTARIGSEVTLFGENLEFADDVVAGRGISVTLTGAAADTDAVVTQSDEPAAWKFTLPNLTFADGGHEGEVSVRAISSTGVQTPPLGLQVLPRA